MHTPSPAPSLQTNPLVKTASFAIIHFTVAFGLAYALTGNAVLSGSLALIEPVVNTVAFYLHELVWTRLRRPFASPAPQQGIANP